MKQSVPSRAAQTAEALRKPQSPSPVSGMRAAVQRAAGNQALQRMALERGIQTKLEVSTPGDALEQEADRVAAAVIASNPAPPAKVHRAPVAARSAAGPAPSPTRDLEESLGRQQSQGQPLTPEVRGFFEPRFGRDLSGVRMHTGPEAASAAAQLGAHAFTHGQHIYFGAGRYQPDSESGRRLIAHELTHTLQQAPAAPAPRAVGAPGIQRSATLIQRQTPDTAPPPTAGGDGAPAPAADPKFGVIDENAKTLTFETIEVPAFKLAGHRGPLYASRKLKQKKNYKRGEPDQRAYWKDNLGKSKGLQDKLKAVWDKASPKEPLEASQVVAFKGPSGKYAIGTLEQAATEFSTPNWDKSGARKNFDVDHIVELQLANWDDDGWANTMPNMELLESGLNRSSGSSIKGAIDAKVKTFKEKNPSYAGVDLKKEYTLQFNAATGAGGKGATENDYWTPDQIREGVHITNKVKVDKTLGDKNTTLVFPSQTGGVPKNFGPKGEVKDPNWLKPFQITSASFDTENTSSSELGTISMVLPPNPDFEETGGGEPLHVARISGAQYAGSLDKGQVRARMRNLKKKGLSPIEVGEFEILDTGIYVAGQIKPSISALEGVSIDFEISNGQLTLSKTFSIDEIKVPKPFKITACDLTISASTGAGFVFGGQVAFEIQKVGSGTITGKGGPNVPFTLEGTFNFDTSLFSQATATIKYTEGEWSFGGKLAIEEGKVTGIKHAEAEVSYENDTFRAAGTADLNAPGIQKGTMEITYSEAAGLGIKGKFDLASDIPMISGGSVEAEVQQREEGWSVKASGTAKSTLEGFNAALTISYDKGIITIAATAGITRGMLSGTITAGATNQEIGEDGQPTGAKSDRLRAFGSGTVSVTFAPWLKGEVGVKIKPEGGMVISGTVGIPSTVDVFPEKNLEKNLFTIGLDIPIVGVAVLGQRIGIFATIKGGLDAKAGFGPGQLRNTQVSVTYDPDNEAATVVSGTAEFYVPASAGLRLFVRGGLGAGIPVVSATANLEVGGEVGIEGEAKAAVDVEWTPTEGVDLKAEASLQAQPKFKFDVTGSVLVEADLLIDTIELYSKKWKLASFEYGSDLTFGVSFPIHYKEGEPFDVSVDDLEFTVPDVDPGAILTDLIGEIA